MTTDFAKQFLLEDAKRLKGLSGRQVLLLAFGKHPGWTDYFDVSNLDVGTPTSYWTKTLLHLEGLAKRVSGTDTEKGGSTEKRDSGFVLPRDFVFVWKRASQFLIGRFWPSQDASGRPYPMFVCFHCLGLPLDWALPQLLPHLEEIQRGCLASRSELEVRSTLQRTLALFRQIVADLPDEPPGSECLSPDRERFLASPQLGLEQRGVLNVIHYVRSEMGLFLGREAGSKLEWADAPARRLRVPLSGLSDGEAILLWSQFLDLLLSGNVPRLFTVPSGQSWLDVTVGRPKIQNLLALLHSIEETPPASSVPYELDDFVTSKGREMIAAFRSGVQSPGFGTTLIARQKTDPKAQGSPLPESKPPEPPQPRKRSWWGLGGTGLAAAAALFLFVRWNEDKSPFNQQAQSGASALSFTNQARVAANERLAIRPITSVRVNDGAPQASRSFSVTAMPPTNTSPTISSIPDQVVDYGKDLGPIAFTIGDKETRASQLRVSAFSSEPHVVPTANVIIQGSDARRTVTVWTVSGKTGTALIILSVSDGQTNANTRFALTVRPANSAPTISRVTNQTLGQGQSMPVVRFRIGDSETSPKQLQVSARSSNPSLVPTASILIEGTGYERTLKISPVPQQSGQAQITLSVSDGLASTETFFRVNVMEAERTSAVRQP